VRACGSGGGRGTNNLKVWLLLPSTPRSPPLHSELSPAGRGADHGHLPLVEVATGARGELAQRGAEARGRKWARVAMPARIIAKEGLHRRRERGVRTPRSHDCAADFKLPRHSRTHGFVSGVDVMNLNLSNALERLGESLRA